MSSKKPFRKKRNPGRRQRLKQVQSIKKNKLRSNFNRKNLENEILKYDNDKKLLDIFVTNFNKLKELFFVNKGDFRTYEMIIMFKELDDFFDKKKKILEDTIYDTEADPILYIPRKNVSKVLDVFDPEVSNKNNINPISLIRYKSEKNRSNTNYVNNHNKYIQKLIGKAKLRQTKNNTNNTNNTNNLNRFSNRSQSQSPNF